MQTNLCWIQYIGIVKNCNVLLFDEFIQQKFGNRATPLYTDTDSLIITVETDDFYEFMKENIDQFNIFSYKVDNEFNTPVTKSILEKMKDIPYDIIINLYAARAKS